VRRHRIWVLATVLASAAVAADLKVLYKSGDWFALRDAMRGQSTPSLYGVAVAAAFSDVERAEQIAREVVRLRPESDEAARVGEVMIYALQRRGDYRAALSWFGTEADAPDLFRILAREPRQRIVRRRESAVKYALDGGNIYIPATINGRAVNYLFDTGANMPAVSESEALRLGLAVQDTNTEGGDASGHKAVMRVAVARSVTVGGFELANVAFVVLRDDQKPFAKLEKSRRGIIGLPIVLALETVRWRKDGYFEIGVPSSGGESNLCLDNLQPVLRGEFAQRPIRLALDTGASHTDLLPAFAEDFPAAMRGARVEKRKITGVNGTTEVSSHVLERIALRLGGRDLELRNVHVIGQNTYGAPGRTHVWAGLDIFTAATAVTLDFRAMRISVE